MDDDDLLGGGPVAAPPKPAAMLDDDDDDDLLGGGVPTQAPPSTFGALDVEENDDLFGGDHSQAAKTSSPTNVNKTLVANANEAMKLAEGNTALQKKIEQCKAIVMSMKEQVEALKPSVPQHSAANILAQKAKLASELTNLPPMIDRMRRVGEMANAKIHALDAELERLRNERKAELEKNRPERENADVTKHALTMQLQKHAFQRELDNLVKTVHTYETYLSTTDAHASNVPAYCLEADTILQALTEDFFKERDAKTALKVEVNALEEQIQGMKSNLFTVQEELKHKRMEVLKLSLEWKAISARQTPISLEDNKDFDDMIGGGSEPIRVSLPTPPSDALPTTSQAGDEDLF